MDTGANILQEITNQTKTPNHPYGVSISIARCIF